VRSIVIRVTAGIILAIPFVLLGKTYGNLPDEVPVLRTWNGRPILWAEKSLVTVFRVPVIGVVSAAAAGLMRRHFAAIPAISDRKSLQRLWLILLITACVKALFEGFDFAPPAGESHQGPSWFGGATMAVVAAGLALAAAQLPRAWPTLKQRDQWRLLRVERWALIGLGLVYISFAIVPLMLAGRHTKG
jgi:hypothetical protein